jgi:hypothetical protein
MRIIIDIMIGLMVVAVLATGLYLYNTRAQDELAVQTVREALLQFEKQAAYHTTVQSAMADQDVLLVHIDERWFGEDVPTNALLTGQRPWIDLAPPGDVGQHPPDPVAYSEDQASFWYNPTTGMFRARVAPAASEAMTLALYNEVNGTALPGFDVIPDTSRQPIAHTPDKTPARHYASMANKTWSEAPAKEEALATDLIEAEAQQAQRERSAASGDPTSPDTELAQNDLTAWQDSESAPEKEADDDSAPEGRRTLRGLKAE